MAAATIRLREAGWDVFHASLTLHDYLWFASTEQGAASFTSPLLHNYALCYAINGFERMVERRARPEYEADLAQMPIYVTPARPTARPRDSLAAARGAAFTWNALDERTQRTDTGPNANTPMLGQRRVLLPGGQFDFYVFAPVGAPVARVIRLGKKRSPAVVGCSPLNSGVARHSERDQSPTHAVNPLDVAGQVRAYAPAVIPPHYVYAEAVIADDWFVADGSHLVHVPQRIIRQCES